MDIFEELGIRRYINAQDTFTKYGASCMSEASVRAMYEISCSWVDLDEVQRKAGDAIAGLTHNEAAYLTNGAAGGLMVCAASALAMDSEEAFETLPDTGARCEIVVQRAQHNSYDSCLRTAGAKLVGRAAKRKRLTRTNSLRPSRSARRRWRTSSTTGVPRRCRWRQWCASHTRRACR